MDQGWFLLSALAGIAHGLPPQAGLCELWEFPFPFQKAQRGSSVFRACSGFWHSLSQGV